MITLLFTGELHWLHCCGQYVATLAVGSSAALGLIVAPPPVPRAAAAATPRGGRSRCDPPP